MRRVNNKGFTLVELLAIIVITALVLGIGIYSVTKLIGNSKKEANIISTNSIKDSASVYSDEDSNRWIEQYGDDYSYFCVTVEELINKGIIKKNATLPDNIDGSTYVSIKKNRVTLVKGEAVILDDDNKDITEYGVCSGTDIKNEKVTAPSLDKGESYTDGLSIPFTNGAAESGIKDKWCQYNTNSTIKEGENVIILGENDKSCNIDNLKNNTDYYVRVCMTTNGGSRACSATKGYSTKDFISPDISYSGVSANIKYVDDGINSGKAEHYFKSNVSGNSSSDVYECDDNFNCSNTTTKNINKDKWYKLNGTNISIDYSNSDGINDGEITAKISDGSNSMEVNSEFTLYKVVFKVGNADSIDGSTNDITKRCLAKKGIGCKMTSPSISKYCYSGMGWNTSNNADSSIWASKGENVVSNSGTYYPTNGSVTNYIIRYDANGGSGAPSSQTKVCGVNLKLSSETPTRVNYRFLGWSTSKSGNAIYDPGDTYSSNSSITLYASWAYRYYCSYTGRRYDSYSEALSACTVSRRVTTSKTSSTTYTYSCPSGYTCNGSSCTSSSTCSKTVNGTITTKYYCSHNSSYQNSSTCSYVGGYYDDSYGLNCVSSNCTYTCSTGVLDTGKCYADYAGGCPSGWTKVKANGYCSFECGALTQGVSVSQLCTGYGLCSNYGYFSCTTSTGYTIRQTDKLHANCTIEAYHYQCSKDATQSNCSKKYTSGSKSGTSTSGSCASGYTASRGSSCSTKINKDGSYYCDTRNYWAGRSCTASMTTGATARYDMNCSKTGDVRYYCSITGSYTASKPSCTTTETANLITTSHTTSSCPSGYTEDSSGSCYRYVNDIYDVS